MNSLNKIKEATAFLPEKIRYLISAIDNDNAVKIKEIRIKSSFPISIISIDRKAFLKYNGGLTENPSEDGVFIASKNDMDEAVRRLCDFSFHSFQNEMKNGYITVRGGHRVGICATAVTDAMGNLTAIKNVSSLNIRISREVFGCADELIYSLYKNDIKSVLIVGEPASGKTTLLRDAALRLSGEEFNFLRVCVVDERKEITSTYDGFAKNKIGVSCDVLDGYPKAEGMMIALRAISPDVIVCDEIGDEKDVYAIQKIANAGVKLLATIHSSSFSKLLKRPQFARLMDIGAFDVAVVLEGKNAPCKIKEIVPLKKYWR